MSIIGLIQRRMMKAATARTAFDSGTVDAVDVDGNVSATPGGQSTASSRIPSGGIGVDLPSAGDPVLLMKVGGSQSGLMRLGRSPYEDGATSTHLNNFEH